MLSYLLDEIKKDIVKRGSGFANGLSRIEELVKGDLPRKEKITVLKNEYGVGGRSVTLALYDRGMSMHDSKGIEYRIYDECEEERVNFSWSEVLSLYEKRFLKGVESNV